MTGGSDMRSWWPCRDGELYHYYPTAGDTCPPVVNMRIVFLVSSGLYQPITNDFIFL